MKYSWSWGQEAPTGFRAHIEVDGGEAAILDLALSNLVNLKGVENFIQSFYQTAAPVTDWTPIKLFWAAMDQLRLEWTAMLQERPGGSGAPVM